MLSNTTRARPRALLSLKSVPTASVVSSYSASPAASPRPPRTSQLPSRPQRRSIATLHQHPSRSPPYQTLSSLLRPVQDLVESLQSNLAVKESSRWVGRALADALAPGRPPDSRSSQSPITFVDSGGKEWCARRIVVAYAGAAEREESRQTTGEEGSAAEVVNSLAKSGDPAGTDLREVLCGLRIEDSLFLSWRKVVQTSDVRDAVALLQDPAATTFTSPQGKPLWPFWLVKSVMKRSSTSLEAHLVLALVAHHLPCFTPSLQASLMNTALDVVSRTEMVAALPELVNLALAGNFLEGSESSSSKVNTEWRSLVRRSSASEPDLTRHLSSSPSSSTSLAISPSDWADRQRGKFFSKLLRILAFFPTTDRTLRKAAPSILTSQIARVISHMLARSIPLLPGLYDELCRSRFLRDEHLKDLLFQQATLSGLEQRQWHVDALLASAVDRNETEVANECVDLLGEMEKDKRRWARSITKAQTTQSSVTTSEMGGTGLNSLIISKEDAPSPLFTSHSVHFLSGITDPVAAIGYLQSLRLPPRTSSKHAKARRHASKSFPVLLQRLASPSSDLSSAELLGILDQADTFVSGSLKVSAVDRVMRGLLSRGDHLEVFKLWKEVVEDEGLTPTIELLHTYLWACAEFETHSAGLKMMDEWAVRRGVHRIVPETDASNSVFASHLAKSQVLVHPTSSLSSSPTIDPPIVRIQLDSVILAAFIRTLTYLQEPGSCLEISFRIWDASETRWEVTQSTGMLDALLEAASYVRPSDWGTRTDEVREWETRRLDVRLTRMEKPKPEELDEEGGIDWSRVDIERFFALPSPAAVVEEAVETTAEEGEELDASVELETELWPRAKWLFEEIVTSNWPFLVDIPHPFDDLSQAHGLPPILGVQHRSPVPTPDDLELNSSPPWSTLPPIRSQPILSSTALINALLPAPSLYSHLYPTPKTFHYYVRLLVAQDLLDEVPFAFAWMRHLSIFPEERTMVEALAGMGTGTKGWRKAKGEDEGEMMRAWLGMWLGEKGLPGREEVTGRWEVRGRERWRDEKKRERRERREQAAMAE